jgi:hypothetical protein
MADRKSKPQFSGILNQPIQLPSYLAVALQYIGSEQARASKAGAIDDYLFQQRFQRICALAEHYDVNFMGSDGSYEVGLYRLLVKLAEDFVPGFKTGAPRRPGRPKGTGKGDPRELASAIEHLTTGNGRHTVSAACTHLSKSSKSPWRGENPRSLQERYRRFSARSKEPSAIAPDLKALYDRLIKIGDDETHEN